MPAPTAPAARSTPSSTPSGSTTAATRSRSISAATEWPAESGRRSGHPFVESFTEARERGLVVGACAFCANAFGATKGCREAGIDLLGTAGEEHGPDVAAMADDGYELLTVG